MRDRPTKVAIGIVAGCLLTGLLRAENWPNWRGTGYSGSSKETGLPIQFSKTENVKWSVEMPGVGASTPVIWGDSVFLTAGQIPGGSLALAYDRRTGKELWRREFTGYGQDDRSNFSAPSAVTDGERVYFFFGSGRLACFDFAGKEIWKRDICADYGDFAFQWTFSSSPALGNGRLFLQVLQRDVPVRDRGRDKAESFLLAMDSATGKELYRHVRPSDALMESRESFATPIPHAIGGRWELLVAGGDCLTGHDPATGIELWRWGTWNPTKVQSWRLVPSPVSGGGVILACAPKGDPIYAVEEGLQGAHEGTSGLKWKSAPTKESPVTSDVATPLFYQGRFYVVDHLRTRALSCLEPSTGRVIYTQPLESREKFEASPTGADGKIYLINHLGDVFVVQAGDRFKLLHKAEMGTSMKNITRSSIAVSQGNLFIRTDTHLYCVGR